MLLATTNDDTMYYDGQDERFVIRALLSDVLPDIECYGRTNAVPYQLHDVHRDRSMVVWGAGNCLLIAHQATAVAVEFILHPFQEMPPDRVAQNMWTLVSKRCTLLWGASYALAQATCEMWDWEYWQRQKHLEHAANSNSEQDTWLTLRQKTYAEATEEYLHVFFGNEPAISRQTPHEQKARGAPPYAEARHALQAALALEAQQRKAAGRAPSLHKAAHLLGWRTAHKQVYGSLILVSVGGADQ